MVIHIVQLGPPRDDDVFHRHRHKHTRAITADGRMEILRRHAHDREGMAVDHQRLADHASGTTKARPPVVVRQHHHRIRILRRLVLVGEQPPCGRIQPEHLKIISAHHFDVLVLGLVLPGDTCVGAHRRQHAAEDLVLVAQVFVHRVGIVIADVSAEAAHGAGEASVPVGAHQFLGPLHGQHAQHHLVEQGEDGRRCPNAERQCHHGGHGKTRRLSQLPPRIFQISKHCILYSRLPTRF